MSNQDSLKEEYKIIQEKIDKIGDFKFKIRGWYISIQSAVIVALATGKIEMPILIILLMISIILLFQLLEKEQEEISRALGERAKIVEKMIIGIVSGDSPKIAIAIRNRKRIHFRESLNSFYIFQYLIILLVVGFYYCHN